MIKTDTVICTNLVTLNRKKFVFTPYVMIAPAMILFILFTFYPFLKTIYLTFFLTNAQGKASKFVGLANYKRILTTDAFWLYFKITNMFALMVGLGTFFLSVIMGLMASSIHKGSRLYEVMYAMPMAVASAPASIIFSFMFSSNGILNHMLGTNIRWLTDVNVALKSVAGVTIWASLGVSFIFLMTGFRGVPDELIESSTIDGATKLQKIRHILIPVASPQIFFVIFLNIANSFKAFAQIRLLTSGGPAESTTTLIYALYEMAFFNNRFESACVLSLFLFLIIFFFTKIQFMFEKKVNY